MRTTILNFNLLKFSLQLLNIIHLHPIKTNLNIYICNQILFLISAFILFILVIMNLMYGYDGIPDLTRKFESICTLMQVRIFNNDLYKTILLIKNVFKRFFQNCLR